MEERRRFLRLTGSEERLRYRFATFNTTIAYWLKLENVSTNTTSANFSRPLRVFIPPAFGFYNKFGQLTTYCQWEFLERPEFKQKWCKAFGLQFCWFSNFTRLFSLNSFKVEVFRFLLCFLLVFLMSSPWVLSSSCVLFPSSFAVFGVALHVHDFGIQIAYVWAVVRGTGAGNWPQRLDCCEKLCVCSCKITHVVKGSVTLRRFGIDAVA